MMNKKFFLFLILVQFVIYVSCIEDTINATPPNGEEEEVDNAYIEQIFKDLGFEGKESITKDDFRKFVVLMLARGQKTEDFSELEKTFFNKVADKIVSRLPDIVPTKDIPSILNPDFLNEVLADIGAELEEQQKAYTDKTANATRDAEEIEKMDRDTNNSVNGDDTITSATEINEDGSVFDKESSEIATTGDDNIFSSEEDNEAYSEEKLNEEIDKIKNDNENSSMNKEDSDETTTDNTITENTENLAKSGEL